MSIAPIDACPVAALVKMIPPSLYQNEKVVHDLKIEPNDDKERLA